MYSSKLSTLEHFFYDSQKEFSNKEKQLADTCRLSHSENTFCGTSDKLNRRPKSRKLVIRIGEIQQHSVLGLSGWGEKKKKKERKEGVG